MGFLWRARGTSGWGSSWGLLNVGFIFTLFLNFAVKKNKYVSLPLISVMALSFMLTVPAWGTFLRQITGLLDIGLDGAEAVFLDYNPVSGVLIMILLGFGLASVYGVLLGRAFGKKEWKLKDYAVVLIVFIAVNQLAKATVSHLIFKLIAPQAVEAFNDSLVAMGINDGVYKAYMEHFSSIAWAKYIEAGRNYFTSISTISLVVAAVAVLLTTRFFVKDKYAAKTGALVCSAFAFSITVSDLFFFFENGGYKMAQGLSLPSNFGAWTLWEFFTGFIAGGIITAYLLKSAPAEDTPETLLNIIPEKPRNAFTYVLCVVAGIGINIVRPIITRISSKPVIIASAAVAVIAILSISFIYYRKKGVMLQNAPIKKLSPVLCLIFIVYVFVQYMFIGIPEIDTMNLMHNILFTVGGAVAAIYCIFEIKNVYGEKNA